MRDRPPPECPRCGYDLSGAIAAWPQDQCPCDGRCSECGLAVLWRDVLNPAFAASETFFETARRGRMRAFLGTWVRSLWPWRLWRNAAMQFPLSPWRLIVFVMGAVVLLWSIGVAALLVRMQLAGDTRWTALLIYNQWGWLIDAAWPAARLRSWAPTLLQDWLPTWLALGWLWLLLTPLTFRLVPQTLRRAKVRRWHIVRIWAYSLVGLPLLMFLPFLLGWLLEKMPSVGMAINRLLMHRGVLAVFVMLLWSMWPIACWSAAAKHYLRLERPRTVAVVLVLLGGLAVVTLAVVAAAASSSVTEWMIGELS